MGHRSLSYLGLLCIFGSSIAVLRVLLRNDRPRLAAAESLSAEGGRRSNAAPARSMLPRQELESRLAQLAKDVKRLDNEVARTKRRLLVKEAENMELKKELALAASLRGAPLARRTSEPPRGDPVPATPLPARSSRSEPVAGGKERTENDDKQQARRGEEDPQLRNAARRGEEDPQLRNAVARRTLSSGTQASVGSQVSFDAGAAAGGHGRRLPNQGASLEARRSSLALSNYATRGAPPEMSDAAPTPLVEFLCKCHTRYDDMI